MFNFNAFALVCPSLIQQKQITKLLRDAQLSNQNQSLKLQKGLPERKVQKHADSVGEQLTDLMLRSLKFLQLSKSELSRLDEEFVAQSEMVDVEF